MFPSKKTLRLFRAFFLALTVFLLASCSGYIGYGVVTWSSPENSLTAGDIVPVFIQSNIGKVFVVGTGKGSRKRVELPLWQITLYKSKSRARTASAKMAEYRYTYATVTLDGLPVRAAPENTARQVYRLKGGQKLKIIGKGAGTPVLAGNAPLEGNWYQVMTDDGSTGWCFSYNLKLYDERDAASGINTAVTSAPDPVLDNLLSRTWYPDSWRLMIQANQIDLTKINPAWGFFPGKDTGIARLESADGSASFPYSSISRASDGSYTFEGSSLTVQVRNPGSILVQYTDKDGMPHAVYLASLDTTPDVIISGENARRSQILDGLRNAGPVYSSGSYGVLQFLGNGRFLWNGWQLLSPSIIPSGAGPGGNVEIRCFLSPALSQNYTGVISFMFDTTNRWVHFLYIATDQGLKLEQVSESNIKDSVVLAQNLTPTVVFFTPVKKNPGGQ